MYYDVLLDDVRSGDVSLSEESDEITLSKREPRIPPYLVSLFKLWDTT